jgi:general secretion pathway protein G
MMRFVLPRDQGFTLIEMSVVVAIIGILYMAVVPMYGTTIRRTKETTLKENLFVLRKQLDLYFKDHQAWPRDLKTLVQEGYIRAVPVDPVSGAADSWVMIPSTPGAEDVFDLRSGAKGESLDGQPYSEW